MFMTLQLCYISTLYHNFASPTRLEIFNLQSHFPPSPRGDTIYYSHVCFPSFTTFLYNTECVSCIF